MPVTDVTNMKVADLKRELKVRGLSVAGNKTELQERLQEALGDEPLLEDSSITGEDILDEVGVLSDEEKILGADEHELLKSPTTTPTTLLPKIDDTPGKDDAALIDDDILESPTTTTRKIVLKRKSSINSGTSLESSATAKENTEPSPAKVVKINKHNPITMGDGKKEEAIESAVAAPKGPKVLTLQERLELRAKKFGLEAKAAAAAAPTTDKDIGAISVAPVVSSEKQVELLKKRAERFGCVTSTNLAKLDAQEKLLKRKQRFGGEINSSSNNKAAENNTTTPTTTSGATNDEWAEKARKRLDRFKGNSEPKVSADTTVEASATTAAASSTTTT